MTVSRVRQQYPVLCRGTLRYPPTTPILAQNLPDKPANIFFYEKEGWGNVFETD